MQLEACRDVRPNTILSEIADDLRRLLRAGREVAVHGIEGWRDAASGRIELARMREVTGAAEIGVRMHWLFYDEESASRLEDAGYSYDSTVGYNDAVGYRAGTVGKFSNRSTVHRLLELPMHMMDTAIVLPFLHEFVGQRAKVKKSTD